ncbi:MAG: hypothetical protein P4L92_01025 [Rudaea sp.]|nr:hypothetical protein [Rudaea sp.]
MKVFVITIVLAMWYSIGYGTTTCANDANVYVQCGTDCATKPNTPPNAITTGLASTVIAKYVLCPTQPEAIWIQGLRKTPGGYTEYDWYFDVGSSGDVVFNSVDISNEQVPRKPKLGGCAPGAQCLNDNVIFSNVEYPDYYAFTEEPCGGEGEPSC